MCGNCTASAALAALPTAAQLGKGWRHDAAADYEANFLVNETVAPTSCQRVVAGLAPLLPYQNPTSAQATYLHNAPYGPYLNVVVSSHPGGAPSLQRFESLTHAFNACHSFTTHDPYGTVRYRVVASRWTPTTRTFTAQLRAIVHGHPEWNDLVITQEGPTTVEVWDTTAGPPTMQLVTRVDRQTLARVHT